VPPFCLPICQMEITRGRDQEREAAEVQEAAGESENSEEAEEKKHQTIQLKQTHRKNKWERRKLQRVAIHVESDALLHHGGPLPWPVQRLALLTIPGLVQVHQPWLNGATAQRLMCQTTHLRSSPLSIPQRRNRGRRPFSPEELESLEVAGTWGTHRAAASYSCVIPSGIILKVKHASGGSIDRYRARLVLLGHLQRTHTDCNETYALLADFTVIRDSLFGMAGPPDGRQMCISQRKPG
jgi:hypothetical protein